MAGKVMCLTFELDLIVCFAFDWYVTLIDLLLDLHHVVESAPVLRNSMLFEVVVHPLVVCIDLFYG